MTWPICTTTPTARWNTWIEINPDSADAYAKRGKVLRADPIVGLYERDEVKHLGHFKQLEEQMCTWVPDQGKDSPDRIDALVYALQELMAPPQIPSIHRVR